MPHSSVDASPSPRCSKLAAGLMSCTSTAASPASASLEFGGPGGCSLSVSLYRMCSVRGLGPARSGCLRPRLPVP
eukprot:8231967-Pyramimonas_sp.AAC.1